MPDEFAAQRIDHVAIIVADLARSQRFYTHVLGLREIPRPDSFDFVGAWYQLGPTYLHLLQKPHSDPSSAHHFCIWVKDVRAAARKLQAADVAVRWHIEHKIPGVDRFFIHDPDGNRIEVQGPEAAAKEQMPVPQ